MPEQQRYRLVTRSDLDGLVCAALLKSRGIIDEILFAHPKDVQDGKVAITERDVTTNLPYSARAHLVFDHHSSEKARIGGANPENLVLEPDAPSAARVVYNHFGGKSAFPSISDDLMTAVDKTDSAQFTRGEILDPQGWSLLGFLVDSRTGLGRFRNFGVSNYQLMMEMIDYCAKHGVEDILKLPNVAERVKLYKEHQEPSKAQLRRCSQVHGKLVVVDLRGEETIYAANRFMVYALFPETSVSMHVMWGLKKQNTVFAIGKSIFDRASKTDIGRLCLKYGGGGHAAAGTCQVTNERADTVMSELIRLISLDDRRLEPRP